MADDLPLLVPGQIVPDARSETYREIYSNFSRIGLSPWDLTLIFGKIDVGGQTGAAPSVTTEIAITMSPQQFKAFSQSMLPCLQQWEAMFGNITLDERLIMSPENLKASQEASVSQRTPT